SITLVNSVPDFRGNWYYEVGGIEKSNTSSSFFCPTVTLGSPKVQAGVNNTGAKLTVNALPDANLNGNFSNGIVTIAWPSSYGVSLGTVTNNAGVWQVTGSGTSGANNYVNFVNVAVSTPVNWAGGSLHPLFSVDVNQTGTGSGTFSLINGVPSARNGSWYFEFGGSNLTNNTNPFYTQLISQVPLPVELTSFEAQNRNENIELKWTTATEINNFGFELERKTAAWEKIAFIPGSGNSNHPRQYNYTDIKPAYGTEILYRLKQVDNDGKYKYYEPVKITMEAPKEFKLLQNSPNPFNPVTAIKFQLPVVSRVNIIVYNILGREVATLINEERSPGSHIVYWNGRDNQGAQVASGIYLYRIQAGSYSETRKMNLMK
ncbi:MAG: FlgD immunoglobulin-like domain containing protein, partial [Syntrophothermus sp.]